MLLAHSALEYGAQMVSDAAAPSDDEKDPAAPEPLAPTDPEWLTFEKDVRELLASKDPNARVEHNVKRDGKSGRKRQIDTLVTGEICGESIEIGVEAKRYNGPVGIIIVDAFVGKCLDTGVEKGVLYSYKGFDAGAVARAKIADHPKIVLRKLPDPDDSDGIEAVQPPWADFVDEFLGVEACPVDECWGEVWVRGDLDWSGGICDSCGTPSGYCKACGGLTALPDDYHPCAHCDDGTFDVFRERGTQEVTDIEWVSMVVRDHPQLARGRKDR